MGKSTDSGKSSMKSLGYPSTGKTKLKTKTKYHDAKFVKMFHIYTHKDLKHTKIPARIISGNLL